MERSPIDGGFFSALPVITHFVLARHGESEGNSAGIFQGRSDYPLTEAGRGQAAELGRFLSKHRGAPLYCSPLSRARETALIVSRTAALLEPVDLPELVELDTGTFTGQSWEGASHRDAAAWRKFRANSWEGVEGAEGVEDLQRRAERAWTALRDRALEASGGGGPVTVIAVTHAGFLQWLVRVTFGARSWFPLLPTENCCIYTLRVEPVDEGTSAIFWEAMGIRPGS